MNLLDQIKGVHKIVTLEIPERLPTRILCLHKNETGGPGAYYVLAECTGKGAIKWRSLIKDNSLCRLKDELILNITKEEVVDKLDVATILLCTIDVKNT
ncbi:MAG: hypothetical protein LBU79_05815 [Planctomycetota bacterium]|nr:hypothetical protein [Planctomycetota bacterium]